MTLKSRRQFVGTLALAAGAVAISSGAWAQDDDQGQDLDPADVPNLFISPCGQPFRAAHDAPYAVVDWFKQADKNGDGKLDHAEFMSDCAAFFQALDDRKAGYLDDYDIAVYEHRMVPEILALQGNQSAYTNEVDKDGDPKPLKDLDESHVGAAMFSFFNTPEPVTAADTSFRGIVAKADFMALAERHFTALDSANLGYLTLASLPKTEAQKILERARPKKR